MADQITLTIPREPDFQRVAHLVLSGLALRLDLTIENLEDLQLAVDSILDRVDAGPGGETLVVTMVPRPQELETRLGPLSPAVLDELEHDGGQQLGLRRVLDSTVDDVLVDGDCVVLTKRVGGQGG